jgi:hypothetical protein
MALKHVGRIAKTGKKVIVAYRVIPGEPDYCLVVPTESLDAASHDSLMTLVESNAGQNAYELAEAMFRTTLPDGMNMLVAFNRYGNLSKVKSETIEMTPDTQSKVNLAELNKVIAEQKGVTVADLALKGPDGSTVQPKQEEISVNPVADYTNTSANNGVLSDEELAAQYRSQADAMFKEAKRLREQAEELVPTKKKKNEASAEEVQ